jgi:hypothetical protein
MSASILSFAVAAVATLIVGGLTRPGAQSRPLAEAGPAGSQ